MQALNTPAIPSRIASSSNADSYFTPTKPSLGDEPFGDVMNRALTEADDRRRQSERDDAGSENALQSTPIARTNSADDDDSDDASEIRTQQNKRSRSNEKSNDAKASDSPFLAIAAQPPTTSPVLTVALDGKGSSENSSGKSDTVLEAQAAKTQSPGTGPAKVENSHQPVKATDTDSANGIKAKEDHSATSPTDATKPKEDLDFPSTETLSNKPDTSTATPSTPTPQHAQTAEVKGSPPIAASPPASDGISAAKQDMTMQKTEKTLKVAGVAEQDLPGNTASGSEELPNGQKLSAKAPAHGNTRSESSAIVDSPAVNRGSSIQSPAPAAAAAAASPTTPIDTRVLERTHDIVALHAMRLSESGAHSLHVVVKPGAGVQLSLELRQGENGIEVHAALHKGDFEQMSRHWPELQQRLEARGVRISTLTTSENFSSTSQHQFQQSKQPTTQDDPLYAGAFAEFALAGTMAEAPEVRAARASAYRGWETWA